ncbi:hypothetical protein ACVWXU_008062 [Streptomyces sp. TE33382]
MRRRQPCPRRRSAESAGAEVDARVGDVTEVRVQRHHPMPATHDDELRVPRASPGWYAAEPAIASVVTDTPPYRPRRGSTRTSRSARKRALGSFSSPIPGSARAAWRYRAGSVQWWRDRIGGPLRRSGTGFQAFRLCWSPSRREGPDRSRSGPEDPSTGGRPRCQRETCRPWEPALWPEDVLRRRSPMNSEIRARPELGNVVVGVDGSPSARTAILWAAAEAGRRGRPCVSSTPRTPTGARSIRPRRRSRRCAKRAATC